MLGLGGKAGGAVRSGPGWGGTRAGEGAMMSCRVARSLSSSPNDRYIGLSESVWLSPYIQWIKLVLLADWYDDAIHQ